VCIYTSSTDHCHEDNSKTHIRKVTAQEIFSIEALRQVYNRPSGDGEPAFRVFHVQNAQWAVPYLLHKFNINSRDNLVDTDFGRYVSHIKPELRGGKPFLNGRTWKVQYDPWRGLGRTSFGLDYLKGFRKQDPSDDDQRTWQESDLLMTLNTVDENGMFSQDARWC
jgi:hypothetical protein